MNDRRGVQGTGGVSPLDRPHRDGSVMRPGPCQMRQEMPNRPLTDHRPMTINGLTNSPIGHQCNSACAAGQPRRRPAGCDPPLLASPTTATRTGLFSPQDRRVVRTHPHVMRTHCGLQETEQVNGCSSGGPGGPEWSRRTQASREDQASRPTANREHPWTHDQLRRGPNPMETAYRVFVGISPALCCPDLTRRRVPSQETSGEVLAGQKSR
jgi:hypothetical protein